MTISHVVIYFYLILISTNLPHSALDSDEELEPIVEPIIDPLPANQTKLVLKPTRKGKSKGKETLPSIKDVDVQIAERDGNDDALGNDDGNMPKSNQESLDHGQPPPSAASTPRK